MATFDIQSPDDTRILVRYDDNDAETVERYRWRLLTGRNGRDYVVASSKRKIIFLHRLLNNTPPDKRCYFVNGNQFDCRKKNLAATDVANLPNSPLTRNAPDRRYIRLVQRKTRERYIVKVWHVDKSHYGGGWSTLAEAKRCRDELYLKLFGKPFVPLSKSAKGNASPCSELTTNDAERQSIQ